MTSLNHKPPCDCCSTLRDHIAQHYDPGAVLEGSEDPLEILKQFQDFENRCDLTYGNVADYLEELRKNHALLSDHELVLAIQEVMNGREWNSDTLQIIANLLSNSGGYKIREPNETEEPHK